MILKAISKEGAERWESVETFFSALEAILNHLKSEEALAETPLISKAAPTDPDHDSVGVQYGIKDQRRS